MQPYPILLYYVLPYPAQSYPTQCNPALIKGPQNHFATSLAMHNCFLAAVSRDKHAIPCYNIDASICKAAGNKSVRGAVPVLL